MPVRLRAGNATFLISSTVQWQRPVNGLLLVVSLDEILRAPEDQLPRLARQVRARYDAITERLRRLSHLSRV